MKASDGRYVQADGSLAANSHEFVTGQDGTLAVSGIGSGIYTVEETTAPQGYSKVDSFAIDISDNASDLTAADLVDGASALKLTARLDGASAKLEAVDASAGTVTLSVADTPEQPGQPGQPGNPGNSTGFLPKTGDPMWWLMVVALTAVIGSVALLIYGGVARKRDSDKRE